MSTKREKIEIIKRINPARLGEYQDLVRHTAATKIQSIWRGYKCRSCRLYSIPEPIKVSNPVLNEFHEIDEVDNNGKLKKLLDKIRFNSQRYEHLNYSKSQLIEKCKKLNELMKKRASRDEVRAIPTDHYFERASYWLEASQNLDSTLDYTRTNQDPVVDDTTRSLHITAVKNANRGWWKDKFEKNVKWNEQDLEFEAWIAEIERTPF